jgi:hypothetical protein
MFTNDIDAGSDQPVNPGRCNRQAGKQTRAAGAMLPVLPNRGPCHETVTRIHDHLPAP